MEGEEGGESGEGVGGGGEGLRLEGEGLVGLECPGFLGLQIVVSTQFNATHFVQLECEQVQCCLHPSFDVSEWTCEAIPK